MSGGFFDYNQYRIGYIADSIESIIRNNNSTETDEWGDLISKQVPEELIPHFRDALYHLQMAQIYTHRIDWYLSGDDGEQSFLDRLREDLLELESHNKTENENG